MDYCSILIVDDEMITRQGIKHMIAWEREGFQIVGEASNGQEGLNLVERLRPDIVLADAVLPVINGIDFSFILQEKYPQIQLIMLSSYDDFEYIKATLLNGAVDYILKPTLTPESLLAALEKAVRAMPDMSLKKQDGIFMQKQMERYLTGEENDLDMALFKKNFPYMQYRMLGIDLKSACENNRHLMERIRKWIYDEWRSSECYISISVFLSEEILCYLFNYLKKDEVHLMDEIYAGADKISKVADKSLFVISCSFSDVRQIRACYRDEILPCLKQKFYFPERSMIVSSEYLEGGQSSALAIRRFEYEQFMEFMNNKWYDKAIELIRVYTEYLCGERFDEYLIKTQVKNVLYIFLMNVQDCAISDEMIRGEYFKRIDSAAHICQFRHVFSETLDQFKIMAAEAEGKGDRRIRAITEYLWEHSGEKLELADVANAFGFNYHYISSYFNQHISEGFSGYLNRIRVEKACALLKDRRIPISDISGEVGYSDHGYFCRVFKRITGQTPSQYRRGVKEWRQRP